MVATYELTPEQFKDFVNGTRLDITQALADLAVKNAPEATGMLTHSIKPKNKGAMGSEVVGQEYALYVNYGTGPRDTPPPFQPIADWVDEVIHPDPKERFAIIQAIRQKIKIEGTPSNPFISEKTLRQDLPRYAPGIILMNLQKYGKLV